MKGFRFLRFPAGRASSWRHGRELKRHNIIYLLRSRQATPLPKPAAFLVFVRRQRKPRHTKRKASGRPEPVSAPGEEAQRFCLAPSARARRFLAGAVGGGIERPET